MESCILRVSCKVSEDRPLQETRSIHESMNIKKMNLLFIRGGSICNENSFIFTHFIIIFIKRSVSLLNKYNISIVQLPI